MSLQGACVAAWGKRMNVDDRYAADEDARLVTRFAGGDAAAFDLLFTRYQDYVHNIVFGIVGNAEEARDVTQDVFLVVYRSLPGFRNRSRFSTWLYRVAVNRAVDATRSARRANLLRVQQDDTALSRRPAAAEDQPESRTQRKAECDEIQSALMLCPVSHRQILSLRYYRDLSTEEIAETLGCSVTAAKVRLFRARQVFKQHYTRLTGSDALAETVRASAADRQAL